MESDSTTTLRKSYWKASSTVFIPALIAGSLLYLSTQSPRGGALFYLATFAVAAVYFIVWLLWGKKGRVISLHPLRDLGSGAVIGIVLLLVFLAGGLAVQSIPFLVEPVQGLLDNARYGPLYLTVAVTAIAGIGEELFFRQFVQDALPLSQNVAMVISLALYGAVTATQGIPLLIFAALVIGAASHLERRRTGGLISSITMHLVWSLSMLLILPNLL